MSPPTRPRGEFRWTTWAAGLIGLAALPACTHVPVVVPAVKCAIPSSHLKACTRPQVLPENLSFGELLRNYETDRQNLYLCAMEKDNLHAAIEACNVQMDQFNESLNKLNPGPPAK